MKSKKYLSYIRTLPCSHCKKPGPSDPHHLIGIGLGIMGGKSPDIAAVPLCRDDHERLHSDPIGWPQTKWLIETLTQALDDDALIISTPTDNPDVCLESTNPQGVATLQQEIESLREQIKDLLEQNEILRTTRKPESPY